MKNIIRLRESEVIIEHDGKTVKDYSGDGTLIPILKEMFNTPIDTLTGVHKTTKVGFESTTSVQTLKPGDKDFVEAVLLERVRNEYRMRIE